MVIVGVDFSPPSAAAFECAAELARELGTTLELVHVDEDRGPEGANEAGDGVGERAARAWLDRMGCAPQQLVLREGIPWVQLARRAEERSAMMIVIGSHGRSGYQPVALGSTAMRLLMMSPCPVLAVGARSRWALRSREHGRSRNRHDRMTTGGETAP